MLYALCHMVLRIAFKVLFRWEVYGRGNVPLTGGAIIAANHTSYLDPPLLGTAVSRQTYFLARRDLFSPPPWGWLLRRIHAFPVERGHPTARSIRALLALLKRGEVVVIFPEGTRGTGRTLGEARVGLGMLAARSGVPIVPAYISGAAGILPKGARWFRLRKVKIIYGAPLTSSPPAGRPSSRVEYERIGRRVMAEIDRLRRQLDPPAR